MQFGEINYSHHCTLVDLRLLFLGSQITTAPGTRSFSGILQCWGSPQLSAWHGFLTLSEHWRSCKDTFCLTALIWCRATIPGTYWLKNQAWRELSAWRRYAENSKFSPLSKMINTSKCSSYCNRHTRPHLTTDPILKFMQIWQKNGLWPRVKSMQKLFKKEKWTNRIILRATWQINHPRARERCVDPLFELMQNLGSINTFHLRSWNNLRSSLMSFTLRPACKTDSSRLSRI